MKRKIACIIQARTNSKRFPGKILMPVLKKSLLQHQLERLKKLKKVNDLIVATTKNKIDEPIVSIAKRLRIKVFRGDEKNVLKRYYDCATINKSTIIIRITADCPLIDPAVVDKARERVVQSWVDCLRCSSTESALEELAGGAHRKRVVCVAVDGIET